MLSKVSTIRLHYDYDRSRTLLDRVQRQKCFIKKMKKEKRLTQKNKESEIENMGNRMHLHVRVRAVNVGVRQRVKVINKPVC